MPTKIIFSKDQLIKEAYSGAIKEQKVLGYPQEKGPVRPYSSLFYWSHISSDYGCIIPEHSLLGFEILTYVLKGSYEIHHKEQNRSVLLNEGDFELIKAGKGLRHSEKLYPHSEVLQIWFDPDFDHYRRRDAEVFSFKSNTFRAVQEEGKTSTQLGGKDAPMQLNSKDVTVQIDEFNAGFHVVHCPEDMVISGYVLDGFIEVGNAMLGKRDFFKIEGQEEVKLASLVNSRLLLTFSPYKPEYQTYAAMSM